MVSLQEVSVIILSMAIFLTCLNFVDAVHPMPNDNAQEYPAQSGVTFTREDDPLPNINIKRDEPEQNTPDSNVENVGDMSNHRTSTLINHGDLHSQSFGPRPDGYIDTQTVVILDSEEADSPRKYHLDEGRLNTQEYQRNMYSSNFNEYQSHIGRGQMRKHAFQDGDLPLLQLDGIEEDFIYQCGTAFHGTLSEFSHIQFPFDFHVPDFISISVRDLSSSDNFYPELTVFNANNEPLQCHSMEWDIADRLMPVITLDCGAVESGRYYFVVFSQPDIELPLFDAIFTCGRIYGCFDDETLEGTRCINENVVSSGVPHDHNPQTNIGFAYQCGNAFHGTLSEFSHLQFPFDAHVRDFISISVRDLSSSYNFSPELSVFDANHQPLQCNSIEWDIADRLMPVITLGCGAVEPGRYYFVVFSQPDIELPLFDGIFTCGRTHGCFDDETLERNRCINKDVVHSVVREDPNPQTNTDMCNYGETLTRYATIYTYAYWTDVCVGCLGSPEIITPQAACTNVFNFDCQYALCELSGEFVYFNFNNANTFTEDPAAQNSTMLNCIKNALVPCLSGKSPSLEVAVQLMLADNSTINELLLLAEPIQEYSERKIHGIPFRELSGNFYDTGANGNQAFWFTQQPLLGYTSGDIISLFDNSVVYFTLEEDYWWFIALENGKIREIDSHDVYTLPSPTRSILSEFSKVTNRYGLFYRVTATQFANEDNQTPATPTSCRIYITENRNSIDLLQNPKIGITTDDKSPETQQSHNIINAFDLTPTLYNLLFLATPELVYSSQQLDDMSETVLSIIVRQECTNWYSVWLRNGQNTSEWSLAIYSLMVGSDVDLPPEGINVTAQILMDIDYTLTYDYADELCQDPCSREGVSSVNCSCSGKITAKCGDSIVRGIIFYDLDRDGEQQLPLEFGIFNVTLEVLDDSNADGTVQAYKRLRCKTASNIIGAYSCEHLVQGNYITELTDTNEVTTASCQEITTGSTIVSYCLNASQAFVSNFGFFPSPGSISGRIWYDETRTGNIVENRGFQDILTKLFRDIDQNEVLTFADELLAEFTTSQITGFYEYPSLAPGSYLFVIDTTSGEIGELELIQTSGGDLPFAFLVSEGEQFPVTNFGFGPPLNPGTCEGICGSFDENSVPKCFCSADCISRSDCCEDIADFCAKQIMKYLQRNPPTDTSDAVFLDILSTVFVSLLYVLAVCWR